MDWVEEAPERELPERDDDSELGFTSLALGASASSLEGVGWWGGGQSRQRSVKFMPTVLEGPETYSHVILESGHTRTVLMRRPSLGLLDIFGWRMKSAEISLFLE